MNTLLKTMPLQMPSDSGLQSRKENIAIFVDDDNFFLGLSSSVTGYSGNNELEDLELIKHYCDTRGHVVYAKVFAVPEKISGSRVNSYFEKGFDFMPVPLIKNVPNKGGKSLADSVMICDAMTALHMRPEISTYVLVTGDKDFVPLILTISRHSIEKHVIVIAPLSSSAEMIKNTCASLGYEYMSFEDLKAAVNQGRTDNENE